jgi:nitrate reductase gamma subunit
MEAGRTVFLNVPDEIRMIFYVLAGITVLIFAYGIWSRITFWSKGEDEDSETLAGLGRGAMLRMIFTDFFSADCFLAKRVFTRSKVRGILLIFIVWSFVILFLGTVTVTADYDFNLGILKGGKYLAFSMIMDLAGLTLLLGTGAALLRRYVIKPERMLTYMEDGTILALLFLTVFFGFATEGLRMAVTQPPGLDGSPVGAAFAAIFNAAVSDISLIQLHLYAWVMHFVFAFSFIAYIPYSKQFHMFAAQITTNAAAERRAMNKKEVRS